ncbi:hypothetical protein EDB83DRAFT_2375613 [Lactarius deliciosus]|nr:hypothetical protein EDB83DRAFT_2375613 [Lactarius deliciosus]
MAITSQILSALVGLDDESDGPGNDGGGGGDLEVLEGEDLLDGLRNELELLQQELKDLEKPTPYEHVLRKTTAKEWKKAEAKRGLGYNGQSARRKREIAQQQYGLGWQRSGRTISTFFYSRT